jgi:hypothetical protein
MRKAKDQPIILKPGQHGPPNTWDYRVIRTTTRRKGLHLEVCEVYFDSRGIASGYCSASAEGEDLTDVRYQARGIFDALKKSVIDAAEIDPSEWNRIRKEPSVPMDEFIAEMNRGKKKKPSKPIVR